MNNRETPLVLIDASSYFFRAFHALPPLTNSHGQPTGAIYGVINMVRRLQKDYADGRVVVVFDAKGKTFRDDLYAEYKATRPPTPQELTSQFEPLLSVIKAMGLPLLMVEGVEADDVIGTLAQQASAAGQAVVISTGDKDMAQLVDAHVHLLNTMNDTRLDSSGVLDKFGVPPERIIDYLTLIGDKTDNIPGVPKVGPKTAVKWLQEYGSLAGIIAHADEIQGKVGENLREHLDKLPLSLQLVTIKCDVDLNLTLEDLTLQPAETDALIELFTQLEFKTWLQELLGSEQSEAEEKNYTMLTSNLQQWIDRIKEKKAFVFDTETTSLDALSAELVGVSLAVEPHTAVYIPVGHDYVGAPGQLTRDEVLALLKPLFADESVVKIGQNLKYDINVLHKYGIEFRGTLYDTMLESYILNSSASRHDMNSLALKYLGKKTISFETVAGKGAKQLTFNQVATDVATEYAAEDADITLQLHEKLYPQVQAEDSLASVFKRIEMPLMRVLARMERIGVLINADLLAQQSKVLTQRIIELQKEAYGLAGCEFNLSSTKQLQAILYEKMQLPVTKKTPKGQPSTAEAVLHELAHDYPLPKVILEYRSLTKLKTTYLDALPHYILPKTGRVHTSYNQAVAATGRLSSTNPNLQNIPVRTAEGRQIRQAFVAPNGHKMVAADYSQIELRIMAHLSNDKSLHKAFAAGEDIHKATAAEVFTVAIDQVSVEQRRSAKAINFGLIYGMSAYGLSKQIDSNPKTAQQYMDRYFERYPGVKNYMESTREKAREQGYVETIFGRRLYLPEIRVQNLQRRHAAERAAINAPMQGSAADIIKLAMIHIDDWLQQSSIEAKMIMQVHDELIFEVAEADIDTLIKKITEFMTNTTELRVPLQVDIGIGDNWDEAH